MSESPLCLLLKELQCTPPIMPPHQNFGSVKWLIICLCGAQQTVTVTVTQAVSPTWPPCCCTGHRWPSAPSFHGRPAEGKRAHLPSLRLRPHSKPPPPRLILLPPSQAKGRRSFAFKGAELEVPMLTIAVMCGRAWCVAERRGGNGADQRAARSIYQLIVAEQTRAEWEERWRRGEKMIKRSCVFLSSHNGSPPSSVLSLSW